MKGNLTALTATMSADLPFDPANRAYQRFTALASEHFHVLDWCDANNRPTLTTLLAPDTGDGFTVMLVDTATDSTVSVALALHADGTVSAYGPLPGRASAKAVSTDLRHRDDDVVATLALPLDDPGVEHVRPRPWCPLPDEIAGPFTTFTRPTTTSPASHVVIVVDGPGSLLCVLGPFGDHGEAQSYLLSRTDLDGLHTVAIALQSIVEDADPPARAAGQ